VKFNEIIRQVKDVGISGAIYTQTSDVEGEVNGLLTYDRKVIKIPAEELKKIHKGAFKQGKPGLNKIRKLRQKMMDPGIGDASGSTGSGK